MQEDFKRTILETLGKEGKSISALAKDLEKSGYKIHRLIITGYLRALSDMQIVKEKDIPPSKVYTPINSHDDNVYSRAYQAAKETCADPDKRTLQMLHSLLRRPVFESELRLAGVDIIKGKKIEPEHLMELRTSMPKRLKMRFHATDSAYMPDEEMSLEDYARALEAMTSSLTQSRHLVLDTKQSKLI